MEIENTATLRGIINSQNKTIDFLYKEQSTLVEKANEKQEQLDAIFDAIAELYDAIEEGETDKYFILEELAKIQALTK